MKLVQPVPEYCVGIDVSIPVPVPQVRTGYCRVFRDSRDSQKK